MKKKIVIIHQQDIKECGPCCLLSIIKYYDGNVSLEKVKEDCYTSKLGTTIYDLKMASIKYGFDAIAQKCLDKKIVGLVMPCIAHVTYENGLNHFVCLYYISKDKVILMDPAKGKVIMPIAEFDKIFTGVVLTLYPKNKILYLDKKNSILDMFLKIIKDNTRLCLGIIISSFLLTFFSIMTNLYFKFRYEMLITNQFTNSIKIIIYLFLLVVLLKLIYEFRKSYYESHLSKNIDVEVFQEFIGHIFSLPLKVINNLSTGEIITRIGNVCNIKDFFIQIFVSFFLDGSLLIFSLIVLCILNIKLTIVLILILMFYFFISVLLNPYIYKRVKKNIEIETKFNSTLVEYINMFESVKNLNKTNIALLSIEKDACLFIYDNFSFMRIINVINILKASILDIGVFLINTIGFYFISRNKLTLVDLVVFNSLMYYLIDPIKNIVSLLLKYNFLRANINKINDFLDIKQEAVGDEGSFVNGKICFNEVEYAYNNRSKILRKLNFTIDAGDKVMITGKSGSGKSTICHLLERNIEPTAGYISINGKNILDYSISTIRKNIVYVGQHEHLLSDTIKNNILFYNNVDQDFYDKICRICLIDEIVAKRPLRYDFGIDNYSANISGGEKQRIVLARALLNDSKIIILDEALSETDYILEKKIINNIIKAFPDKTFIYISHKNQEKCFNKIVRISDGTNV